MPAQLANCSNGLLPGHRRTDTASARQPVRCTPIETHACEVSAIKIISFLNHCMTDRLCLHGRVGMHCGGVRSTLGQNISDRGTSPYKLRI